MYHHHYATVVCECARKSSFEVVVVMNSVGLLTFYKDEQHESFQKAKYLCCPLAAGCGTDFFLKKTILQCNQIGDELN